MEEEEVEVAEEEELERAVVNNRPLPPFSSTSSSSSFSSSSSSSLSSSFSHRLSSSSSITVIPNNNNNDDSNNDDKIKKIKKRRMFTEQQLTNIKEILESSSCPTSSSSTVSSSTSSSSSPNWYYYYVKKKFKLRVSREDTDKNVVVVNDGSNRVIVSLESIFDIIHTAHTACGHGGEKRTYYEIRNHRNIANITNQHIKAFISLCQTCKRKKNIMKKKKKNGGVDNRIVSSKFGERGQVDLIDLSMNCTSDGYKYILNYQDHLTKFLMLKPLKSKRPSEVNDALLNIFATLGVPEILQCDNGAEFSGIQSGILDKYWPNCKLTHSRPRHPQSQGSIERANGDVMNILRSWLSNNNNNNESSSSSSSWVDGLNFVQLQKNNSLNRTINCTPFMAVFGREMPVVFNNNNVVVDDGGNDYDDDDDDDLTEIYEPENDECSSSSSNNDNNSNLMITATTTTAAANINNERNGSNLRETDFVVNDSFLLRDDDDNIMDQNSSTIEEGEKEEEEEEEEKDVEDENNNNDDIISVPCCSTTLDNDVANNVENVNNVRKNISNRLLNNSGNNNNNIEEENEEEIIISRGTPVIVKIPKIDCHKLGFPNIIGVIYEYLPNVKKYNIKTRHGIINRAFSSNDFEICPNLNVDGIEINDDKDVKLLSLRKIARLDSIQFVGCQCYGRCQNNKCICYKQKKLCGSLCKHKHLGDSCFNKKILNEKVLRRR